MYSVAVVALSALLITAAAPTAFAEDRSARVDDSHQADGEIQISDISATDRPEDAVVSSTQGRVSTSGACRGSPTSFAATGCQGGRGGGYNPIRSIDWSAVGPSTDDFSASDETYRLQGARLVATYRF